MYMQVTYMIRSMMICKPLTSNVIITNIDEDPETTQQSNMLVFHVNNIYRLYM